MRVFNLLFLFLFPAPITLAMHSGLMLGPVIGGVMLEALSISSTYFLVGSCVVGIAALNQLVLDRNTHTALKQHPQSSSNAFVQVNNLKSLFFLLTKTLGVYFMERTV